MSQHLGYTPDAMASSDFASLGASGSSSLPDAVGMTGQVLADRPAVMAAPATLAGDAGDEGITDLDSASASSASTTASVHQLRQREDGPRFKVTVAWSFRPKSVVKGVASQRVAEPAETASR